MELLFILFISIIILLLPMSRSQNEDSYYYDTCAPLLCGNTSISFPFTSSESFCGLPGYEVACDHSSSIPTITLSGIPYSIHQIIRADALILLSDARLTAALTANTCDPSPLRSHFLPNADFSPLHLPSWGITLNFSLCGGGERVGCGGNESLYLLPDGDGGIAASCRAELPVQRSNLLTKNASVRGDLLFVVGDGFPLQWTNVSRCWDCEVEGGRCGYNQTTNEVKCFCGKNGCGR